MTVRIEAPRTDKDRAVLQPLLDDNGRLDDRVGRLLIFGGRIGAPKDITPLEIAAEAHGATALGGARELLEDTCADSGVAALRQQLLVRHDAAFPGGNDPGTESGAAAWDGTRARRGEPAATYSDAKLQPWGPSLHFCFDEAGLRERVHAAMPRLARQLRRSRPARIVLVGHADYEGTCRRNEELARRRAQAVRRALTRFGLHGAPIEVASLGERRPLDFATTREAHALNRRVEILVETEAFWKPADGEPQRVVPGC